MTEFNETTVYLTVSELAWSRLSQDEVDLAVKTVFERALANDDWGVGKNLRLSFTCRGKGYTVALDNRADGIFCLIGLPQEVVVE